MIGLCAAFSWPAQFLSPGQGVDPGIERLTQHIIEAVLHVAKRLPLRGSQEIFLDILLG